MNLSSLLPRTRQPFLLAVVLLLAAICMAHAALWLMVVVVAQEWLALVGVFFWSALAAGLWRLHPLARGVAVVMLWLVVIVLIVGTFNPFNAGDLMAEGRAPPSILELSLWIAPVIVLALLALHVLGKHKTLFHTGKDAAS